MWLTRMLLGALFMMLGVVVDTLSTAVGSAAGIVVAVALYGTAGYFFVLAILRGGDQWR